MALDRQVIVELVYRYAPRDRLARLELLASLFVPGAMLRHGLFDGPASERVAARRTGRPGYLLTHRPIGNALARIDGDRRAQRCLIGPWLTHVDSACRWNALGTSCLTGSADNDPARELGL